MSRAQATCQKTPDRVRWGLFAAPLLAYARNRGRMTLRLRCLCMGEDMCVLVDGGDRPHTGAVVTVDATGARQFLCLPGHRETEIAATMASRIQAATRATVTVLCGIHLDNITPAEIQDAATLCDALTADLLDGLKHAPQAGPPLPSPNRG